MEQVAFVEVPEEWTDINDLLTSDLTSGNSYQIEARGSNVLVQEAAAKPTDEGGVMLDENGTKTISYTVGTNDLWVKALGRYARVNIVDVTPAS